MDSSSAVVLICSRYDVTAGTSLHLNLIYSLPICVFVLLKFVMQIFFSLFSGEVRREGKRKEIFHYSLELWILAKNRNWNETNRIPLSLAWYLMIIARTTLEVRNAVMSKDRFSLTFRFLGQGQRISFTDKDKLPELTSEVHWSLVQTHSFKVKMAFIHITLIQFKRDIFLSSLCMFCKFTPLVHSNFLIMHI